MSESSLNQLIKDIKEEGAKVNSQTLLKRHFVSIPTNDRNDAESNGGIKNVEGSKEGIRILQWNLLAQGLCKSKDGFILCPDDALEWENRKFHMLEELLTYSPDVLCLQEVDQFSFLESYLQKVGFNGIFFPKPDSPCLYTKNNFGPDGCAIFWDTSKLKIVNNKNMGLKVPSGHLTNQVAIICKFELLGETGDNREFYVSTTHLKSKVPYHKQRLLQGSFLEDYLRKHCEGLPLILCGDFNAESSEEIIHLIKASEIGFCSAYSLLSSNQDEPPYTTWKVRGTHKGKQEICHTIDYLFFTSKHFKCLQLLQFPTSEEMGEGLLPSYAYPSDHLSLVADLQLTSITGTAV